MLDGNYNNLRALLRKHEGFRSKPYLDCCGKYWRECECPRDKRGKLTICYGRNLDDVGISEMEGAAMLTNDIARVAQEAVDHLPWFKSISVVRQDGVLNMLYNLGLQHFLEFKRMIQAVAAHDYNRAADEMMASHWSAQVGPRAVELASMMRTGNYPRSE